MRQTTPRLSLWMLLLAASLTLATGCSSFERDWKAALDRPYHTGGVEGPWLGTWRSDASGHTGKLRCIVEVDEDEQYLARFKANYGGIFSFRYDVPMTFERDGDLWRFNGEADLGRLAGGEFVYGGWIGQGQLICDYVAQNDYGVFEMQRPGPSY